MAWWIWIVVGFVLLVIEVVTPGAFVFAFFGVAALVVGILDVVGVTSELWSQWLLFSLLSVGSLAVFRRRLVAMLRAEPIRHGDMDTLIGGSAYPDEDLAPGATGRAESGGTSWTVRNGGDVTLRRGQRCHITKVEGLTLWVAAETEREV